MPIPGLVLEALRVHLQDGSAVGSSSAPGERRYIESHTAGSGNRFGERCVEGVRVGELRSTASSNCGNSCWIRSGSRDTRCTVMWLPAMGTGARNGKSMCPAAEETVSPTTLGGGTNEVSQVPPCDQSGSVSAQ